MKIEFDGIADLREFLEFAGYTREAATRIAGASSALAAPFGESPKTQPPGAELPQVGEREVPGVAHVGSHWMFNDGRSTRDWLANTASVEVVNTRGEQFTGTAGDFAFEHAHAATDIVMFRVLDDRGVPELYAPVRAIAGGYGFTTSPELVVEGEWITGGPVDGKPVVAQTEPEAPARRKRRTKAELQAAADAAARADGDNAAAQIDPAGTAPPTDAQAAAATSPLAGANPFDASTSNEPAATAALNEAPAGATGTLAALGSEVASATQSAVDGLGAEIDAQSFMQLRVAEMGGTFDPHEHMKKCVEFIGALGKAKYDEAFTLAGTSRAVASYTPADCAKHIAALEYLQIAG